MKEKKREREREREGKGKREGVWKSFGFLGGRSWDVFGSCLGLLGFWGCNARRYRDKSQYISSELNNYIFKGVVLQSKYYKCMLMAFAIVCVFTQ